MDIRTFGRARDAVDHCPIAAIRVDNQPPLAVVFDFAMLLAHASILHAEVAPTGPTDSIFFLLLIANETCRCQSFRIRIRMRLGDLDHALLTDWRGSHSIRGDYPYMCDSTYACIIRINIRAYLTPIRGSFRGTLDHLHERTHALGCHCTRPDVAVSLSPNAYWESWTRARPTAWTGRMR